MPFDGPTTDYPNIACTRDTPKAIFVTINAKEVCIPKSVIHDDSEVYKKGTFGTLIVAEWFANKEIE